MARTLAPQLARSNPQELEQAHAHCRTLLAAARRLAVASGHDPDVATCREAGCRLPGLGDDGTLCALAHRLGLLANGSLPPISAEVALAGFLTATTFAVDAVRACRQTAHPGGYCWFAATPGGDGCAEVLRLAHRLA